MDILLDRDSNGSHCCLLVCSLNNGKLSAKFAYWSGFQIEGGAIELVGEQGQSISIVCPGGQEDFLRDAVYPVV